MFTAFIIAILALFGLAIATHFFFPLVVGAIALGTGMWMIMMFSIVAFAAIIMGVFVATSVGIFALVGIGFVWLIVAILLFPLVFPILVPLFVIMLFMTYVRRRQEKRKISSTSDST